MGVEGLGEGWHVFVSSVERRGQMLEVPVPLLCLLSLRVEDRDKGSFNAYLDPQRGDICNSRGKWCCQDRVFLGLTVVLYRDSASYLIFAGFQVHCAWRQREAHMLPSFLAAEKYCHRFMLTTPPSYPPQGGCR